MTTASTALRSFVLVSAAVAAVAAIAACSASDGTTPGSGSDADAADAAASSKDAAADAGGCGIDPAASAQAITFGATLPQCITSDANAIYELTAPEGTAGGYIQVHLTNVVGSAVKVTVTSLFDKSAVLEAQRFDDDQPVHGYVAVKGGTSYRITVERRQTYDETTRYDLAVEYKPFIDAYEPNNDVKSAKPISLATDISAMTLDAYEGKTTSKDENYHDWFSFNASAAPVTIKVTNPDPARRYDVQLLEANGASVASATSPSEGADARLERTLTKAGTYLVRIRLLSYYELLRGDDAVPPPMFTTPYTLRIEQ